MTVQMCDLVAQRVPDGWTITRGPRGGNSRIHLFDEQGRTLRSIDLRSSLDDFSRFAHWTTAGTAWDQQMLAYLTEVRGEQYFVVRAWWGARLVISLDELDCVNSEEMADDLHQIECDLVLTGLQQVVSEMENGSEPNHDQSTDVVECTIRTLAHLPGLLPLPQAIPLLRVLEERARPSGSTLGGFHYSTNPVRLLAQISLRRLGEKPRGHPTVIFLEERRRPERAVLCQQQPEPVDGNTRHSRLCKVKKSTPMAEVYQLLGAPDYIGGSYWRYDIDADEPCTVLLGLAEDDTVGSMVKCVPPFWKGPELFPASSVIDHDGAVLLSSVEQLKDGGFVGQCIELDVLQDIEHDGRSPQTELARLLFEGDASARFPLIDALEEAGDARVSQVRSWFASDE